jgi:predicted transcriptional regulator
MQEIEPGPSRPVRRPAARRRSELELDMGILAAIHEEECMGNGGVCATRVQARVVLSWNLFKKHLAKLEQKGLVAYDGLRLTEEGIELLQEYRREMRPVLNKYGY